ncbi:hypothetical protein EMCRGX_G003122 [Ephydatia muelleri]
MLKKLDKRPQRQSQELQLTAIDDKDVANLANNEIVLRGFPAGTNVPQFPLDVRTLRAPISSPLRMWVVPPSSCGVAWCWALLPSVAPSGSLSAFVVGPPRGLVTWGVLCSTSILGCYFCV